MSEGGSPAAEAVSEERLGYDSDREQVRGFNELKQCSIMLVTHLNPGSRRTDTTESPRGLICCLLLRIAPLQLQADSDREGEAEEGDAGARSVSQDRAGSPGQQQEQQEQDPANNKDGGDAAEQAVTADSDRKGGDDGSANGAAAERKRSRSRSRDRQRQDRSKDRRRWALQCVHCSNVATAATHKQPLHTRSTRCTSTRMVTAWGSAAGRPHPVLLAACHVLPGLAARSAKLAGTGEGVECCYVEH